MKLKTFNAENSAMVRQGKASLNINYKSGVFTFSATAAKQLGFEVGDHVELHQDETKPKDWYVSKTADINKGFRLRAQGDKNMLSFNNSNIARLLVESLELDTNCSMLISKEPITVKGFGAPVYPIITSSATTK